MTTAKRAVPFRDHTHYPDSDSKPMGETPRHVENICNGLTTLEIFFAKDPQVYVGGTMFVYFARFDPDRVVCPDLFVVKGVPKVTHFERRSYRMWEEEGKGPNVVIEFTSFDTRQEDLVTKKELYRKVLKVKEYFLFDPFDECLRPPLKGYLLTRDRYIPIKPVHGRLPSRVLGLHLENGGRLLCFWNRATQQYLLTSEELEAKLKRLRSETEELRRRPSS